MDSVTDHGPRKPRSGRGGQSRDGEASSVANLRNPYQHYNAARKRIWCTKIGTWNVKTMYEAGKIHNAIKEMERLSIGIMGVSEMRWTDSGKCVVNNHQIYYSGNPNGEHINGVGIILNEQTARHVTNFIPISERLLLIQLNTTPIKSNIIQVYAPTADKADEIIEAFYNDLTNTLRRLPKNDLTIIMGDFNAKVGNGQFEECIGPFGLGERNERGERLIDFVMEEQFIVTNTFFKLPPRRLYTWKSPQDTPDHITRNQIDYIMVNKRFRNSITSVKTHPGADIKSDHNLLLGTIKLKLKKIQQTKTKKHDIRQLKNECIKQSAQQYMKEHLSTKGEISNTEEELGKLHTITQDILDKYLKPTREKKKEWMSEEILDMMEDRRKVKNNDIATYKRIDKEIKNAIRNAKNDWLTERCTEIQILQQKHDSFNLHKKVKEAANLHKPKQAGRLTDTQGNLIIEVERRRDAWMRYVEETFRDERRNATNNTDCRTGPLFTTEEVRTAIRGIKDGKTTGPDNFYSEFLKLMDDNGIKWLTKIFNNIYNTGEVPQSWLKSTFVTLPKKPNAKKCDEYRIISLMSHLLKTFLKIIHKRLYKKCEEHLTRTQFGFRDALGTREALFAVQVLFQRCRDVNCDIYVCFVDYQKAFDRVKHDELISLLAEIGIDDKDQRIIKNIYYNQTANIKVDNQLTEAISIERGVRQGCILSPMLFNVYSERIFKQALEEYDEGILINGERLNNIRYADDAVVFADSMEGLQTLMARITEISQNYGLDLNTKKTKYMVITKRPILNTQLMINQQPIERVESYTYLGTNINSQWDHSVEIKQRIAKARAAFIKMSTVLRSRDLPLKTKIFVLQCYTFPVLLYGTEAWTLSEASMKKLEAFEMWCYRRILRISWVDRVTNIEVLHRMGKECEVIKTIKKRKLEYLGHIIRNEQRYGLLQLILQGKVYGKRGPGRRRISWLQNLRKWFNMTTTGLFRIAANKVKIAMLVANIRNE